jgi:hypothetical protein
MELCFCLSSIAMADARFCMPLPPISLRMCSKRDMFFIGTQFSNLYTAVDMPAEAA